MKNLKFYFPLVNNGMLLMGDEFNTGKEIIDGLFSDDIKPPPKSLNISISHTDGKTYTIYIPYSDEDEAKLNISDE